MSRGRPAPPQRANELRWLLVIGAAFVVLRWGVGGALVLALLYVAVCVFWPIATCGKCQGTGRCYAPIGTSHRTCPRCDGKGVHVRVLAAIWHSADD